MALRKISFVLLMFDKVLSLKELQWVKAIVLNSELWKLLFLCGEYQGNQVAVAMRQLTTIKDFGTIPQLEGQHLTETPMIHFSTISSAFLEKIKHTISLWKYQEKPFHDRSKLKPRVFLMHVFHGFTSPPSHSCFLFCGQFSPLPLDLLCCLFPRSFILTFCLPAVSSGYLPGVLYSHGCPLYFALYFWDWEFAQCIYLLFVLWALWWLPTNF